MSGHHALVFPLSQLLAQIGSFMSANWPVIALVVGALYAISIMVIIVRSFIQWDKNEDRKGPRYK